jgi:hypothetical protein
MTDKFGTVIYKNDYIKVKNMVSFWRREYDKVTNHNCEYEFIGRVLKSTTIRTGFMIGGTLEIFDPHMGKILTVRDQKSIIKLTNEEAMLWKLENE